MLAFSIDYYGIFFGATQSVELFCTYTRCTGFFCLAIIKGPPNDIYFIIEGPCDGYFTEKVSQARYVTHELRLHQNDRCKRLSLF